MARDYASIHVRIWGHPDVRNLSPMEQWLYLLLWTHPQLSYAGVIEWKPGRLVAPLANGATAESIEAIIPALEKHRFVVVDRESEELFVRPYFRFDGVLKQRTLPISMVNAYSAVGSNRIRAAIIGELKKLSVEFPEWKAWALPQVREILRHPAVYPGVYPGPDPGAEGKPEGGVWGHPTDTDTDTASQGRRARETPLPKSWAPTADHIRKAKELGIDPIKEAERFRLHAEAHDRRAARWNAAFTMWLSKAQPTNPAANSGRPVKQFKAHVN